MASTNSTLSPEEMKKANVKKIWRGALILAVVTGIEFALAFMWPESVSRTPLNILFIVLTLVKAFYIVAEFMHLEHEVPQLIYSILIPTVFVVWLIIALFMEGGSILKAYGF